MKEKPWDQLEPGEMTHELLRRNSKFQMMISFLGMVPMPAAIKDRKGRIVYLNRRAEAFWGVKLLAAQGQMMADLMKLSESDAHALHLADRKVLLGEEAVTFYDTYHHMDNAKEQRMCVLRFPVHLDNDVLIVGIYIMLSNGEPTQKS